MKKSSTGGKKKISKCNSTITYAERDVSALDERAFHLRYSHSDFLFYNKIKLSINSVESEYGSKKNEWKIYISKRARCNKRKRND